MFLSFMNCFHFSAFSSFSFFALIWQSAKFLPTLWSTVSILSASPKVFMKITDHLKTKKSNSWKKVQIFIKRCSRSLLTSSRDLKGKSLKMNQQNMEIYINVKSMSVRSAVHYMYDVDRNFILAHVCIE